ncbi:MAG: biotin/lipoyl-binding protein [Clostridia bacterium]|nr:biotin/lipoyl-binding protein [Clostridia bacterium]
MKRYNVTVNGVTYDVVVEEVNDSSSVQAPAPAEPVAPKAASAAGGTPIKAPMPGTILKLNVSAGQSVKKGDVVAVLEAMKMENEIFAPADGTVLSVNVNKGASVKTDDVIATIK